MVARRRLVATETSGGFPASSPCDTRDMYCESVCLSRERAGPEPGAGMGMVRTFGPGSRVAWEYEAPPGPTPELV